MAIVSHAKNFETSYSLKGIFVSINEKIMLNVTKKTYSFYTHTKSVCFALCTETFFTVTVEPVSKVAELCDNVLKY